MRSSISSSTTRTEGGSAGTTAGSIETMVWHFHLEPMDQPAPVAHLWLRTVQLERLRWSDLTGAEEQRDNIHTAASGARSPTGLRARPIRTHCAASKRARSWARPVVCNCGRPPGY